MNQNQDTEAQKIADKLYKPIFLALQNQKNWSETKILTEIEFDTELKNHMKPEQKKHFKKVKKLLIKKAQVDGLLAEAPLFEFIKKAKSWWQSRKAL